MNIYTYSLIIIHNYKEYYDNILNNIVPERLLSISDTVDETRDKIDEMAVKLDLILSIIKEKGIEIEKLNAITKQSKSSDVSISLHRSWEIHISEISISTVNFDGFKLGKTKSSLYLFWFYRGWKQSTLPTRFYKFKKCVLVLLSTLV